MCYLKQTNKLSYISCQLFICISNIIVILILNSVSKLKEKVNRLSALRKKQGLTQIYKISLSPQELNLQQTNKLQVHNFNINTVHFLFLLPD